MSRAYRTRLLVTVMVVLAILLAFRVTLIVLWRRGDQRVLHLVGLFNRRWLNPRILAIAGKPHSPYAVIQHVGRRSGRAYATPVITGLIPGGFIIPLGYGDTVDWYRNMQAAGACKLQWQGTMYTVGAPELLDAATALPAFPRFWQTELRLYGVKRFIRVMVAPEVATPIAPTEAIQAGA